KEVPVFDELQLLKTSDFATFVARAELPDAGSPAKSLAELADRMGGCAEDWSTSVRMLCKACSEGRPHATHDTHARPMSGAHTTAPLTAWRTPARSGSTEEQRISWLFPHGRASAKERSVLGRPLVGCCSSLLISPTASIT